MKVGQLALRNSGITLKYWVTARQPIGFTARQLLPTLGFMEILLPCLRSDTCTNLP
jgi:hypothetical protein